MVKARIANTFAFISGGVLHFYHFRMQGWSSFAARLPLHLQSF